MRALLFSISGILSLAAPSAALAQSVSDAELYEGGPDAPVVLSTQFPDQEKWYRSSDARFAWGLPGYITAVSAELSNVPDVEPQQTYRPPISELTIKAADLKEGTQYLLVQFRNVEKWGRYTAYKLMIDDTPPEPFRVGLTTHLGEQRGVVASFAAEDKLSGVAHFGVSLNQGPEHRVSVDEARRGYFLPIDGAGEQRVSVRAYDRAGNIQESSAAVVTLPPVTIDFSRDPAGYAAAEPASILVAIMSLLTLLMFSYMVYERQRYARGLAELRGETDEVQMEMLKVFSALREEIYDQINAIDKKPRLSKKEKEAIDGLNKALDVSERLLQKEVKDVKKIIA